MMLSVFIHPVFLFSYSTMSNYLDQKLTAWFAGWVEQSLRPRPHLTRICRAPCSNPAVWSVGLAPGHLWRHYLVLGQQDRVLQVVFYPNDQKPTVTAVKPLNISLIKIRAIMLA